MLKLAFAASFSLHFKTRLKIHLAAVLFSQRVEASTEMKSTGKRRARARARESSRMCSERATRKEELLDARFLVSRSNVTDPIDFAAQRLKQNHCLTGNVARRATVYSNRLRQIVPEIRGVRRVRVFARVYVCAFALDGRSPISLLFLSGHQRRDPTPRKYITLDVVCTIPTSPFARIYSFPRTSSCA